MFRWFLATTVAAIAVANASAAFVVNVVPSVGPDRTFSADFAQYAQNAAFGLQAGTTNGTVGSANFWAPAGTAQGGGAINYLTQPLSNPAVSGAGVTNLWNGVVNASAPSGQTGNWIYFGLAITTTAGETFRANQVNYNGTFYDNNLIPNGLGAQSLAGAGNLWSNIGGVMTPVTDTTLVNNLYYVGIGTSIGNTAPGDYSTAAGLQALMFAPNTPSALFTGSYTVSGTTGAGGVDINGAPAPATLALMGLGLAGLVTRVRRRMA